MGRNPVRMREAVIAAIQAEMREDPTVLLMGEDVAAAGGVFKTSDGLLDEFGPERVRDTPISEMGFLGAAVGAAMTGLRPVVEIMFVEFLGVALDQLVTQAAKMRYLSAGGFQSPITVRATVGAGLGFGAQHSQVMETWLEATPGLKVAVASGAESAYGLLRSAIRSDDPVVVLEPRALYATREDFDPSTTHVRLGQARSVRQGTNVTIVGLGSTVSIAAAAADRAPGWSADVIDLLTLAPWDRSCVLESVAKTGHLVIVEEGPHSGGWGTEIVSHVATAAFASLEAPPVRVTSPDVPVPYGKELEARYVPSVEYVTEQVSTLLESGEAPAPWWADDDAEAP